MLLVIVRKINEYVPFSSQKTIQDEFLPIRMDGDDNPQTLWSCIIELDGPWRNQNPMIN